jgi:hypothetical protein
VLLIVRQNKIVCVSEFASDGNGIYGFSPIHAAMRRGIWVELYYLRDIVPVSGFIVRELDRDIPELFLCFCERFD